MYKPLNCFINYQRSWKSNLGQSDETGNNCSINWIINFLTSREATASMKSSCQTRWVHITSERHHRKHQGSCSWHNHLKTWAWHPHQRIELSILAWVTLTFVLLCFYVLLSQKQTHTKCQRPAHPEKMADFCSKTVSLKVTRDICGSHDSFVVAGSSLPWWRHVNCSSLH